MSQGTDQYLWQPGSPAHRSLACRRWMLEPGRGDEEYTTNCLRRNPHENCDAVRDRLWTASLHRNSISKRSDMHGYTYQVLESP